MVNVQHNCRANNCKFAANRSVFQEREEFKAKAKDIVHINPNDYMLNCVKTRDFRYVGLFSLKQSVPEQMVAIREGAEREVCNKSQKTARANIGTTTVIISKDEGNQVFDDSSVDEMLGGNGVIDSD